MKFHRVLNNAILILADPNQEKKGELYLPDVAKEPLFTGTVVATGDGYDHRLGKEVPLSVEPDDRVYFDRAMGLKINHPTLKGDYFLLRPEAVLAVLAEDEEDQ